MSYLDQDALKQLNEMMGGDAEFMAELIETFLDDAPKLIAKMKAGDTDDIMRLAHGLKSNGTDFGAVRFAKLCKALEHDAKAGTIETPEARIAELEAEFGRVETALKAYMNG